MIWILGRFCAALALLVLLAACGSDDDSTGDNGTGTASSTVTATSAGSPPPDASPTAIDASATTTSGSSIATSTIESTVAASPESTATPLDEADNALRYEELTVWDATWERLGAMVLGPDGRLYIDDYVREQLLLIATDGGEQPPLAYESPSPEFDELRNDFAFGPDGRIYLLEQSGTARVLILESDGTVVDEWGGTVGFEQESLFDARTIALAPDGHVFTVKPGVLQKFSGDGEFVAAWDRAGEHLFPAEVYDMEIVGDTLYLAATGYRGDLSVILKVDFDGNLVDEPMVVGEPDAEDRIFPASLAIGPDGNLFIADPFTREIIVLSPVGDELTRWSLGPTEQRFPVIEIAVDDAGHVYVADDGQKSIVVYAPEPVD